MVRVGDKMFTELDTVWSSWEMGVVLRFITLWFPIGILFKYIYILDFLRVILGLQLNCRKYKEFP